MISAGLITIPGQCGAAETMNLLHAEVSAKGLTVCARIDHSARRCRRRNELAPDAGSHLRRISHALALEGAWND